MSAARVALKVNIAALELVGRLPIDGMRTIGVCLAAAFCDADKTVMISWAEVGSDTEREWRDAERSWDHFPGGPYEVYEMEEQNEDPSLQRSLCHVEETERNRLGQRGSAYVAERLAYYEHHCSLSSGICVSERLDTTGTSVLSYEGLVASTPPRRQGALVPKQNAQALGRTRTWDLLLPS